MTYEAGSGPSAEESFEASGANLTADITVTAPTNFEVSTTSGSEFGPSVTLTQTGGVVAGTTVYVRLKDNLTINTYNEDITLTSTGADAVDVSVTGEVTAPPPPPATLPYFQDFEGTANEVYFDNYNDVNNFVIGTATNNGGSKSMYISNDSGTSNAYTKTTEDEADTYIDIDLTNATNPYITFDWKSNGNLFNGSAFDFGDLYVLDSNLDYTLINTEGEFVNNSNWTTVTYDLSAFAGEVISINFYWYNDDSSYGNNPPFAIDNIYINDLITWESVAWSNTTGPTATDDVLIKDDLTVSSDLSALTMEIESGHTVTVSSSKNLTVVNSIENNGAIVIENNANLLQTNNVSNTGSGTYKVKRNSNALKRLDYTMWSSPVVGQNLLAFSPNTIASRFYTYNAATDLFNSVTPSTTAFDAGKGYLIRMPDNHPTTATLWNGEFNGTVINNGDISVTATDDTYNAVGNPYPSAIEADDFINDNAITEPLYFWRKENNSANSSYATYTTAGGTANSGDPSSLAPNGVINVGQGFIAKTTSANLVFNNAMRVADNNNQFFRTQNNVERNRIWLNLTADNGASYQTMVAYMTGATENVDATIDGKPFQTASTSLTSLISNESYVIQGRALPFDDNDSVALRFTTDVNGTFTITKANVDGLFANGQEVFIQDNLAGTISLLDSPYTFASNAGTFDNRFEIVYKTTLSNNSFDTAESLIAFVNNNNELTINTKNTIAEIQLFDVTGRLLLNQKEVNNTLFTTPSIWNNSIGILKVTTTNGETISKKIKL